MHLLSAGSELAQACRDQFEYASSERHQCAKMSISLEGEPDSSEETRRQLSQSQR